MIRVLVLIMVTGFLVGVVTLSAAVALGGPELAARNWHWTTDWWDDDDHWTHDRGPHGPAATRELAWDGSTELELNVPAVVEYVQAPGPGVVEISGPRGMVEKIQLKGGSLSLHGPSHGHGRLRIRVSAPNVSRFELNGHDRLEIRGYDQDRLSIEANGSAEILAEGRARSVDLELSGMGEADLGRLATDEAQVDISGAGEAVIAPRQAADLEISGSGEVVLLTRPPQVNTQVAGAGQVIYRDAAPPPPQPSAPATPAAPPPPTKL